MAPTENSNTPVQVLEDTSHQAVSSYFIGPQAENLQDFKDNIHSILDELEKARKSYFPKDDTFITPSIRSSAAFQACKKKVSSAVTKAANLLGKHSLPFWSPRYQAHMCTDMTMPALLGYFMTMIYNPNNCAIEASPLTTIAEIECGEQLCKMFGYNNDPANTDMPVAWGHIACDGTVANLESICVSRAARNLKFYPFTIFKAMQPNGLLEVVSKSFQIKTCLGEKKLFIELTPWELLNLKPKDVLDIPERLADEHGVTPTFMERVLEQYSIQQTGKGVLEREFKLEAPQIMVANTRHYSWPKGAAIAGIGAQNAIGIAVDHGARLDIQKLKERLEYNLEHKIAVYAVVAIMGSTEEGSVDRLSEILALRKRFQARGLSFLVHADAAWGGYFASMLPTGYHPGDEAKLTLEGGLAGWKGGFVPDSALHLFALRFADSITVDPHKAGYIPYPSGGLCYRDGRTRFLVTWTVPYLSRGIMNVTSIGLYGVEGSKPGAAAMSTWLSNKCIGMGPDGYGSLLGEVTWTSSRFGAEWSAMTTPDMDFRVVPLNMLPSELKDDATPESIEEEKRRIRETILSKSNAAIVESDKELNTMALLRTLGSDLNINAFAINFRLTPGVNGKWNTEVEEANYLMTRVAERLMVDSPEDDPSTLPFVLTTTMFSQKSYDTCVSNFKDRLGLTRDELDLMIFRNVVMSPFPTEGNFIGKLTDIFKQIVAEEVQVCQKRNSYDAANHKFLLQGDEILYLIHLPVFHTASGRRQLVAEFEIDPNRKEEFLELKNANHDEQLILSTTVPILLEKLQAGDKLNGYVQYKNYDPAMSNVTVTVKHVVKNRSLTSRFLDNDYPSKFTPFYLYGNTKEKYIDHMLLRSPNTQFSTEKVTLKLDNNLTDEQLAAGAILCFQDIYEEVMQPFPDNSIIQESSTFWFQPGKELAVKVFEDIHPAVFEGKGLTNHCLDDKHLLATGTVILGAEVFIDSQAMNVDPLKRVETVVQWREEFHKIGQSMKD
ncbi:putative L-tyrosine/L-aspartate decarboxylase [Lachnellula suecica]|uniref:Putative L-tyrosine/L-aspartate decarboxylase n=1 Tax=Lachnellula suecica TaxID=602035 RepID=A0A8T9CR09_9HELO|nr:putative L-tyrosine/L-aspartate decarboxylase [Lachnellula suecica]